MKVKIKRLNENAVLPSYAKEGDAAMDLVAIDMEVTSKYVEYDTGLAFEIPEDHVGLLFPRSSVSKKGLILANSVGILDSGYRGSVKFRFYQNNFLSDLFEVGDRVGQIMIIPRPFIEFEVVEELSETTRGEGGFGSTGQ